MVAKSKTLNYQLYGCIYKTEHGCIQKVAFIIEITLKSVHTFTKQTNAHNIVTFQNKHK